MINSLYSFSPDSNVVADEWDANFRALQDNTNNCADAIVDANNAIAFPDSDLSNLFDVVESQPNSFAIPGTTVIVAPESEYYKTLSSGEDITISVPTGLNASARIFIKTTEQRDLPPFIILYNGDKTETNMGLPDYPAGMYMIFLYETNGLCMVKIVSAGE